VGYLAGLMWIYLAMAALLGYLLAYFWREAKFERQRSDFERTWLLRVREAEQQRDRRIAQLTTEVEEHRMQIPTLEKSLAERSMLIADLETDVTNWKDKVAPLEEKISLFTKEAKADGVELPATSEDVAKAERDREEAEKELKTLQSEFEQLRERHNEANAKANGYA